jgi:hypothetical protein
MWHTIKLQYHPLPFELVLEGTAAAPVVNIEVSIEPGAAARKYKWAISAVLGLEHIAQLTDALPVQLRSHGDRTARLLVVQGLTQILHCPAEGIRGLGSHLGLHRSDWDEGAKR